MLNTTRTAITAMIGVLAIDGPALAQPSEGATPAPPAVSSAVNPAIAMEEPAQGDHWIYEVRDEILGTVKTTRTNTLTEVTAKDVSMRASFAGNPNVANVVVDRSWNIISRGGWKYTPNDGSGVVLPLTVGKTWHFRSNDVNTTNGASWTRTGTSKVVGQESVTTPAGTFDTFKIEMSYATHNVNDPTKIAKVTTETWYAPSINHWAKRTFTSRMDGHLLENERETLVGYGRKQ